MVDVLERLSVIVGAQIQAFQAKMAAVTKVTSGLRGSFKIVRNAAARVSDAVRNMATRFRENVLSMKAVLIAAGLGILLKKVIGGIAEAANVVEGARQRLIGIKGSTEAADRAMQSFQETASRVPFTLQEVIESGVALEAFGANAENLSDTIADLAAFMSVSMPEAASAFGRAFAQGAGAADILRDRGVLMMIRMQTGIDDLSKLTLPEFRRAMIETFIDTAGPVAGAAKRLTKTWQGQVSMMGDAWFKLKVAIAEAGVLQIMKDAVDEITKIIKALIEIFKDWSAQTVDTGDTVRNTSDKIRSFIRGLAFVTIGAVEIMKSAWNGLKLIWLGLKTAWLGIQTLIIIGYIKLLQATRSFVSAAGPAFDKLANGINAAFSFAIGGLVQIVTTGLSKLLEVVALALAKTSQALSKVNLEASRKLGNTLGEVGLKASRAGVKIFEFGEKVGAAFEEMGKPIDRTSGALTKLDGGISALGDRNETLRQGLQATREELDAIVQTEAIPFWERAKKKILELNARLDENKATVVENADATKNALAGIDEGLTTNAEAWGAWFGQITVFLEEFQTLSKNVWEDFKSGVGDAVSSAIVLGQDLAEALKNTMKRVAQAIIGGLVKIGLQWLLQSALTSAASETTAKVTVANDAAKTVSGQMAAMSQAPFPLNLTAPAVASGMLAAFKGLVSTAKLVPMQAGGIVTGPTAALVGEGGPEAIIPLDRAGGMFGRQEIQVMLDGELIAEVAAKGMPDFLRVNTGSEF